MTTPNQNQGQDVRGKRGNSADHVTFEDDDDDNPSKKLRQQEQVGERTPPDLGLSHHGHVTTSSQSQSTSSGHAGSPFALSASSPCYACSSSSRPKCPNVTSRTCRKNSSSSSASISGGSNDSEPPTLVRLDSITSAIKPVASEWRARTTSMTAYKSNILDILAISVEEKSIEVMTSVGTVHKWFHDYFVHEDENPALFISNEKFADYLRIIVSFDIEENKINVRPKAKPNMVKQLDLKCPWAEKNHLEYRAHLPHGAYHVPANAKKKKVPTDNFKSIKLDFKNLDVLINSLPTEKNDPRDVARIDAYGKQYAYNKTLSQLYEVFADLEQPKWLERLVNARRFLQNVYTYLIFQGELAEEQFVQLFASFAAVAGFHFVKGNNVRKSETYILGQKVTGTPDLRCYQAAAYTPGTLEDIKPFIKVVAITEVKSRRVSCKCGAVSNELLGQTIAGMLLEIKRTVIHKATHAAMVAFMVECTEVRIALLGLPKLLEDYIFNTAEIPTEGIIKYSGTDGMNGQLYITKPLDFMRKDDRYTLWRFMMQMKKIF